MPATLKAPSSTLTCIPSSPHCLPPGISPQILGIVTRGNDAVIVPSAISFSPSSPAPCLGTLVVDHPLARPGEPLHFTGYLQQQLASILMLALPSTGACRDVSRRVAFRAGAFRAR